ncbi:alpha-1,4 glucan phosphorylase L isozyme, chloroplastic/amyloplastic [Amborella trichopoda]|uniref:alpha-1,4 glucan phosphorylase L isozyme, chloroplastic/amyloplastic n=1 Tax=Amborella trichopoda TaxID=13333 RepID=UPI0005D38A95|nr:alpha-1,4 glucan phosphorylase L isozyme, chloroplastic/amyloplastic [Amborella trichopoda]|eukprot:XP_011621092.1 alpha-1,4 glucan phosphorylase L isozyme, chloroplastic/amyloplastic [Amborella trichopoda]
MASLSTSSLSGSSGTRKPCFPHNAITRFINPSSVKLKLPLSQRSRNLSHSIDRLVIKSIASDQRLQKSVTEEEIPTVPKPGALDSTSIASNIKYHTEYTPSFTPDNFGLPKAYLATAESVRDALIKNWNETYEYYDRVNVKQAYYLSMEFLQGRALLNAIGNLELTGAYAEALSKLGHDLESIASQESDAALGNGGLGRLASCFLDSIATLDYPAWGYGLRYKYGLFHQNITKDGQEEVAESWLELGNPWEIVRNDVSYPVKFYGKVLTGLRGRKFWVGGEDVNAVAYDVPIPGYKTKTTINLRLWSTKVSSQDFDLQAFNAGDHGMANQAHANAEKICYILYPGDDSMEGKILRLKQQYTLCSASLQDIVARFERRSGNDVNWEEFPEKVAVQMNDTHPTLCIPELIRILIDVKGLAWEEAWRITQRAVAYTNHTVLPEALEKWNLELMQKLLPRHVEIIERIDEELIGELVSQYGTADLELLKKKIKSLRILENYPLPEAVASLFVTPKQLTESKDGDKSQNVETNAKVEKLKADSKSNNSKPPVEDPDLKLQKMVRMANLCVVGGHAVNGVAAIHSEIIKEDVFNDFYKLWPEKFQNKTNGVTPRRWIRFCNPDLSKVLTKWLGTEDWVLNTEKLAELKQFADNEELQKDWSAAKRSNKMKAVSFIKEKTGYVISPDAMFDIQVKRIHEYKRQLLNILGIIYRYKKMKEMSAEERKLKYVPRVCIFGGKAFATYVQAKRIVKLITDVGATINHDPDIGDLLKVVFVPDYNVSVAETLIPASELSQHISTAGMEASGTSNMKFVMNGCILIGTLDGANVEIREEVGEDNFFLFGARAHEIAGLRKERREGEFKPDPRFEEAKKFIRSGAFGKFDYNELVGSLEGNEGFGRADYFLVGKDFPSYIECQDEVDAAYRDQKRWTRMSILNTAGSYEFSSDRTIHQYAKEIWGINPVRLT